MFFKKLQHTVEADNEKARLIRESTERILRVNPSLSIYEAIAIAQYIGPFRREINQYLLGKINLPWISDCQFYLNNAINNKLDKFNLNLILKRDIKVDNIDKFVLSNHLFEGLAYESDHFMAFTYDLSYDYYLGNVQFVCKPLRDGKSKGVEMDLYKRKAIENEVLFPLGTKFLIEKVSISKHKEVPETPRYKLTRQDAFCYYEEFRKTREVPKSLARCLKSDRINLEKIFNLYNQDVAFIFLKEVE